MTELREQILSDVVGKASVNGDELLVENGSAKEASQLLAFGGVASKGKGVANAGEDKTGNPPFEWLKESQLSLFQIEDDVALTKFDTVRRKRPCRRDRDRCAGR